MKTNNNNGYEYTLAWEFSIKAITPVSFNTIYVNAINNIVLYNTIPVDEASFQNNGTGWTWYNGSFSDLKVEKQSTFFRLNSSNHTRVVNQANSFKIIRDNNNNWVENTFSGTGQFCSDRKTAHSFHWGIQTAVEYFLLKHNRWGSDWAGKNLVVVANSPFNGGARGVGFIRSGGIFPSEDEIDVSADNHLLPQPASNTSVANFSFATQDVIAHEYAHVLIHNPTCANFDNFGDAGAINEGISDIFGVYIEAFGSGNISNIDWSMGEWAGINRFFQNPHNDFVLNNNSTVTIPKPSPLKYLETGYWLQSLFNNGIPPNGTTDNTIHQNGGVIRKWFYLLANGSNGIPINGYIIQGIGLEKAINITNFAVVSFMWSNIKFPQVASSFNNAVIQFYGACSFEHFETIKSLKAVGLNMPFPLCKTISINGNGVIQSSDVSNTQHYSASIADLPQGGTFVWDIPSGWSATAEGANLVVNNITSMETKKLSVSYVLSNGDTYTDSKYVHISDIVITGDNIMPPTESYKNSITENTGSINSELIYPNPAKNSISIELPSDEETSVTIFDLHGKQILNTIVSKQFKTIDISTFAKGMYIIKINSNSINKVAKFVKSE